MINLPELTVKMIQEEIILGSDENQRIAMNNERQSAAENLNENSMYSPSAISLDWIPSPNANFDDILNYESVGAHCINPEPTNPNPEPINRNNIEKQICTFPTLTEHDDGGLKFQLDIKSQHESSKNYCNFSKSLKKIFICLDTTFFITIEYLLPKINSDLFLRAMMVNVDDLTSPIKRCNNHLCTDKTENEIEKNSYIRSKNIANYVGKIDGKDIKERLSVLIPLRNVKRDENIVTHSVALKFVCQNSCIGRRQTAVIFTLETKHSQILGKKIINVRVCSCPNRDKQNEEKNKLKRSSNSSTSTSGKIPLKKRIKEEKETIIPSDTRVITQTLIVPPPTSRPDISFTKNDGVGLFLEIPTFLIRPLVQSARNAVANEIIKNETNQNSQNFAKLKDSWNNVNIVLEMAKKQEANFD